MEPQIDKRSRKLGWFSLVISVITAVILTLTFISSDYGILTGKPSLTFSVYDSFTIICRLYALFVEPHIEIFNDGKKPEKIGQMIAYISSSDSKIRKTLTPLSYSPYGSNSDRSYGSFIVRPGELWNAVISFSEEFTEEQKEAVSNLDIEIAEYLQKIDLKQKYNRILKPLLSDELYLKLKNLMQSRISWVEQGEYRIILFIFGGKDSKELLYRGAWNYRLSKLQKRALTKLQIDSFKLSPKYGNANIMMYTIRPNIREIKGQELISLINEFDKEPKGNKLSGFNFRAEPKY